MLAAKVRCDLGWPGEDAWGMKKLEDEVRWPLLTDVGRQRLQALREHPHGPRYNHACGDRIDAAMLEELRAFSADLDASRDRSRTALEEDPPEWVGPFLEDAWRRIPFYARKWAEQPQSLTQRSLADLPTTSRDDLLGEPWEFVPLDVDHQKLMVYSTTGTTGPRVMYPAHPLAPARYLPILEHLAGRHGARLPRGGPLLMVQAAYQRQTFVYASVMTYFGFEGFAKVNLLPSAWRDPADPAAFLKNETGGAPTGPPILTGDPVALSKWAELLPGVAPRIAFSSALTLPEALRKRLEAQWNCPVVDLYSTNETGPIAARREGAYEVLPHRIYVELLDSVGRPVAPGEWGEVCCTGGVNPYLPLVRYRTGDFARREPGRPQRELTEFAGRKPVLFRDAEGKTFGSVDAAMALRELPFLGFSLSQEASGRILFQGRLEEPADSAAGRETARRLGAVLDQLFGSSGERRVEFLPPDEPLEGKWISYRSPWTLLDPPDGPGGAISTEI